MGWEKEPRWPTVSDLEEVLQVFSDMDLVRVLRARARIREVQYNSFPVYVEKRGPDIPDEYVIKRSFSELGRFIADEVISGKITIPGMRWESTSSYENGPADCRRLVLPLEMVVGKPEDGKR